MSVTSCTTGSSFFGAGAILRSYTALFVGSERQENASLTSLKSSNSWNLHKARTWAHRLVENTNTQTRCTRLTFVSISWFFCVSGWYNFATRWHKRNVGQGRCTNGQDWFSFELCEIIINLCTHPFLERHLWYLASLHDDLIPKFRNMSCLRLLLVDRLPRPSQLLRSNLNALTHTHTHTHTGKKQKQRTTIYAGLR